MAQLTTSQTVPIFAANDQPDCAALTANGLFYRCFVWLDRTTWTIRACCYRVQPDGGQVVVFANVIEQATTTEIDNTNGVPLDSPKIIPVGTTFVVHWLQATTVDGGGLRDWALWRATMDMTAFSVSSWTNRGSTTLLETHLLYDACPLIGGGLTEFVVARYTAASVTTVQRFDGFSWVDVRWTALGSTSHAPRILGVYAHESDNDVVWTFQHGVLNRCYSVRCAANDGTGISGAIETFTEFADAAGEDEAQFLQVGHCRVSANTVAVVAEAQASVVAGAGTTLFGRGFVHHLVYRTISSNDATVVSNVHWAAHLYMCSRPWAYAGGDSTVSPTSEVYVLGAYRSCVDAYELTSTGANSGGNAWMQSYHYALNLDFRLWDSVSDGAGLRPRVIDTMYTVGVPDGRASGWKPQEAAPDLVHAGPAKRMNHVSFVSAATPEGPEVKTRTLAGIIWARAGAGTSEFQGAVTPAYVPSQIPEHAECHGIVVHMEDPHTIFRDSSDPTQPVDNFRGAYPRYMCQATPVGRGLVYGGGTPYVYDGQRAVELGFVYYPEILDWVVAASSGSETDELTAGVHQIYAIYTWRDSAGQLHRSRPSNVVQFTAALDDILLIRVRTMTLSVKDATAHYPDAPAISIELYATAADATVFYRVFGSDARDGAIQNYRPRDIPANDPTAMEGQQLIYFGLPDSRLTTHAQASSEFAYDANEVFNGPLPVPPPAMSVVATFQNRLWGADSLDPSVIWYSDEIIPEPGGEYYTVPEFASAQFFRIGDIGEITAMHPLDTRLIVFTRSSIYALAVAGDGAVTGSLIVTAQPLHEGIGCISPRSVASYPLGLRFQSDKGIYDLARSGEASYGVLARSRDQPQSVGGAALEEKIANAGNILAASHDPTKHQIRYATNDRPAVVQTWTGTIVVGAGGSAGTWTISGLSEAVSITVAAGQTASQVADAYEVAVDALIAAVAPDTLQFQLASSSSPAGTIVLVGLTDESFTPTSSAPATCSVTWALVETLTTRPRVLLDHYDVQMASTFSLVQTHATTRLAEVVGACYWYGDGKARHVVQCQGATLIQHDTGDSDAFVDQTSAGNVGIPIDLTTAWIHFAGIAGYKRIREIGVVTERVDEAGAMHVDVQYDRSGLLTGEDIQPSTYDWNSPAPPYLRIRQREQKVSSVRVRIYEDSGVTTAGDTVRIVGLVFYAGVKPGMRRVGDAQIGS